MSKRIPTLLAAIAGMLILILVLSASTAAPHAVAAPQIAFNVNSTADLPDNNPGDGFCIATNGLCTLRAALEETNATEGMDTVNVPAGTYLVDEQLQIDDSLFLNGAGADQTILDGQLSTPILRVRTVELLVCDSGNDSVASYRANGHRNQDYISPGAGGLSIPGSVALDPGNGSTAYVSGYSSGIKIYDADGVFESDFFDANAPANFAPTDGVFGDREISTSDYFIADYFPNNDVIRVDRFTETIKQTLTHANLQQPNSITFYDEALFVTSAGNHKVFRAQYDDGTELFASPAEFISSGLNQPRGIAYHDGSLFVANELSDSVARFNADTGASQGTFVGVGSGGLDGPTDLVFGPYGDLYVISSESHDILRYDGDSGAFKDVVADGDPADIFLKNPTCLTWRIGSGSGPIAHIKGLTLQNGRSSIGEDTAGLRVDHGASVTLRDSVVTGNESNIFGGGVRNGGQLEIYDTLIYDNQLPEGFGGQTSTGGGIFNSGHLELHRVGIYENHAGKGGGLTNNNGMVEMTNTTISNNTADGQGGGIRNIGSEAVLWINHSTIVQNEANLPGNGENNQYGGGIFDEGFLVLMGNTILAENDDHRTDFQSEYAPDCHSKATHDLDSENYNIIGIVNSNCSYNAGVGDMLGDNDNPFDPEIGSLFDGYHSLFSFSPAIDAGLSSAEDDIFFDFGCRTVDQRNLPRPRDGDTDGTAKCDIGAFETQPNYFPAECPTVVGNIIDNYCFEDGEGPWQFFTNGAGNFQATTGDPYQGEYKAEVTIDEQGGNVQLFQKDLPLLPNTEYELVFAAYSSNGANLDIKLHRHNSPYTNYGLNGQLFDLQTGWNLFETTFTTQGFDSPVNNGRLRFSLSPYDSDNMTYFIDWVILREVNEANPPIPPDPQPIVPVQGVCVPEPNNLIANSGFESGVDDWGFYTNGSGHLDTDNSDPYECFNNAVIQISEPGGSVQMYQKGLSLLPQQDYVLRLAARSSSGQDMKLFVHKHKAPYSNYGLNGVELDLETDWKTFVIEFSTNKNVSEPVDDARLRFWLAPYDYAGAQFEIDDVVLLTKEDAMSAMAALSAAGNGAPVDSSLVQGYFLDGDTSGHLQGAHVPESGEPLCFNAQPSMAALWPADGELHPVRIEGLGETDGVTITAVTQDEPPGERQNARGVGGPTVRLRAERDPFGEGRVYTVAFTAVYGERSCSYEVVVEAPLENGLPAIDSGAAYDATLAAKVEEAMHEIFLPLMSR
ncbi:MAG: carbohydrate binding domain-containing protein [Candidatus Promineifilaceae bacterium]